MFLLTISRVERLPARIVSRLRFRNRKLRLVDLPTQIVFQQFFWFQDKNLNSQIYLFIYRDYIITKF